MTLGSPSPIIFRKHTFLSAAALGFSAIVIAVIVSCTVILLYGVHLAGEKSERVITLAQSAIRGLPEFADSLPPVFSDMLNDRRQPDYCHSLAITAKLTSAPGSHDGARTAIEVVNNGKEVVSVLSLRIIMLDKDGRLLGESQEWAATPFATDGEWRGPIMPGARRYFAGSRCWTRDVDSLDDVSTEVEITELRIWNGPQNAPATAHQPRHEPDMPTPVPAEPPSNG
jgi:hypothetical protein